MRCLIFIVLVSCAVKCDDDGSYYVVEIPEERQSPKPFRVHWNVPTMQCRSKKIPFENLYEKFGIIQNSGDSFRGDQIAILYDPGDFPALLKNETSGKFKIRNGGVPQEGDLERHCQRFRKVLEKSIPDPDFSGIGIIDFESWRPIFRQNFGVLTPYKDFSYQVEREQHWFWPEKAIQAKARQRFEESARSFMQTTLVIAKKLRPFAQWGYYAYPYCFNMAPKSPEENCSSSVRAENDKISWLWQESTALYPSMYFSRGDSASVMSRTIRGRVAEAARLRRTDPILPYFWYRYRDGEFLPQKELEVILETFYNSSATGFIIWGASNDVNTVDKCNKLLNYTETVLGPAIAKYTKMHGLVNQNKVSTDTNIGITTWRPILKEQSANNTNHYIHHYWLANNTKDIIHEVEVTANQTNSGNEAVLHIKRNTLLDILFNILLSKDMMKDNNEYFDYVENDVFPPNSSQNNISIISTESSIPVANSTNEITSTTPRYTTIDPLNITTAYKEDFENVGSDTKNDNFKQSTNIPLYASEFTVPSDNDTLKYTSTTEKYTTSDFLHVESLYKDLFTEIETSENINDNDSKIELSKLESQLDDINKLINENDYFNTVKEKKEASVASSSVDSTYESTKESTANIDSEPELTTEDIYDSSENTSTLFEKESNTASVNSLTTEIPSIVMKNLFSPKPDSQTSTSRSESDATTDSSDIKNRRDASNKENDDKYSFENLFIIPYTKHAMIIDDPVVQTKNEKKGYHVTHSDDNKVSTDLNNYELTSKLPIFQTEDENEDYHTDNKGDITSTESVLINSSNNDTNTESPLLKNKDEINNYYIDKNDTITSTKSYFSTDEATSKNPFLEPETNPADEVKTDYFQDTNSSPFPNLDDSTDPIVRTEEKFDIGDDNADESEVMGEHLSSPVSVSKKVEEKYKKVENYFEDTNDSTTDNKIYTFDYNEDYSENEVRETTESTTDSVRPIIVFS